MEIFHRQNSKVHLSDALIQVARAELKEFEEKVNEAFLLRAEMNRKLSLL